MRSISPPLWLAICLSLVYATTADAAFVGRFRTAPQIAYSNDGGSEVSTLTIAYDPTADEYIFRDATAELRTGQYCRITAPGEARCTALRTRVAVDVSLGPGNDLVRFDDSVPAGSACCPLGFWHAKSDTPVWSVRGGDGDDVLRGGSGDDVLDGGAGADTLSGIAGDDLLIGGPGFGDVVDGGAGDDHLVGADHAVTAAHDGRDILVGGDGIDAVDYTARTSGVTVDLSRTDGQGGAGENDAISGVENVFGSRGNDVFVGNAAANTLYGLSGDDAIGVAGDGADVVVCNEGSDRVDSDRRDLAAADCERVAVRPRWRAGLTLDASFVHSSLSRSVVTVRGRLRPPARVSARRACARARVRVAVTRDSRVVARRTTTMRGRDCTYRLRITVPRSPHSTSLRIRARFLGSGVVRPTTRTTSVRR